MLPKKNLVFSHSISFVPIKWGKKKKEVEFISRKVGGEEDGEKNAKQFFTLHASNGIKILFL